MFGNQQNQPNEPKNIDDYQSPAVDDQLVVKDREPLTNGENPDQDIEEGNLGQGGEQSDVDESAEKSSQ